MSTTPRTSLIPTVIEQTHRGERGWDIFSRLPNDRIIFVGSEIEDDLAGVVVAQLLRGPGCVDGQPGSLTNGASAVLPLPPVSPVSVPRRRHAI